MPKCEICGRNVKKLWTCKYCGIKFCSHCGDTKNSICKLCLQQKEHDIDFERDLMMEVQTEIEEE